MVAQPTPDDVVTHEELDIRLKGVATKGDIKVVIDRIQSMESRFDGLENKVDAIMDFLVRRFGMPSQ